MEQLFLLAVFRFLFPSINYNFVHSCVGGNVSGVGAAVVVGANVAVGNAVGQ